MSGREQQASSQVGYSDWILEKGLSQRHGTWEVVAMMAAIMMVITWDPPSTSVPFISWNQQGSSETGRNTDTNWSKCIIVGELNYSRSCECPFSPVYLVGYLIILSHNIFPLEPSLGPHFSKSLRLDFKVIHYCPRPAWLNFSPTESHYLPIFKSHQHDTVMSFPCEHSSLLPSPLSPSRA